MLTSASQTVDTHDLRLRHVFISKPNALATHAAILESPKRHRIEAVVRGVVDHDAPGLDLVGGFESSIQVIGENASVEAVFGAVCKDDGVAELVEGLKNDDRGEHLFDPRIARHRNALQDCRRIEIAD